MKRPELGTWHEVRRIADKAHESGKTEWYSYEAPQVGQAMYIGYRTVFNGAMENIYEYGDWENPQEILLGCYFIQSKAVEVWLFVWNGRMNPIRVFPQDTSYTDS